MGLDGLYLGLFGPYVGPIVPVYRTLALWAAFMLILGWMGLWAAFMHLGSGWSDKLGLKGRPGQHEGSATL